MNKICAAKTILAILPQIDHYCQSVQKANYVRAVNSFYNLSDTPTLMNRIIDAAYNTQQLHNLKVKVLQFLNTTPTTMARVTELLFLKALSVAQVAEELKVTQRTVFRLQKQGPEHLANNFEKLGITPQILRGLFEQNRWIRAEYQRQLDGHE